MAYAGHQFGNFVSQLGDGRAILLGEVLNQNGERRDVQLKGAGRTPFSRRGDGRAALGPVLREYLVSEAMHALGIPTTRALAAITTGETVYRDRPLPGAVLTRVASSHIRVGTFHYFAARGDLEAVEHLADYVIDRHFPDARDAKRPPLALLEAVVERQASLIARWMRVGFIHGVMNTDNTAGDDNLPDYSRSQQIQHRRQGGRTQRSRRVYADRTIVLLDDEMVADHPRRFGRDQVVYDPWHYLPVLTRKPGALRNGAPFKDWDLPAPLSSVRAKLQHHVMAIASS